MTFPNRPWKKPECTLLEFRIAVVLLFVLLPSGSWIPLTHGSCSQGCHWLTHPWPAYLRVTGPAESISQSHWIKKFFAILQTTPQLLVFHLAAPQGHVRVVEIPYGDQGLWMGDFYLLAADACYITLVFYLWDLIVFKPLLHTEHDFFPSVLPKVCISLHCYVLVMHTIPPCLCNLREIIALSSCMWSGDSFSFGGHVYSCAGHALTL